ncbi:MAG TPA: BPSS1780 family membrane protein [Roseateles sp.]|nr:BPSS1780 family membrane protein [Roseateles sp.]
MQLHLQTVPARNGALWMRHGFKVFQRRPLAITGLFALFLFAGLVLLLVPVLGSVLLLMSLPLLSLGFMLATHLVLQNQTPTAAVFLAPLKLTPQRRNTQLALCGAYALATVLVMVFSNWVDGGTFEAFQNLLAKPEPDSPAYEAAVEAALLDPRLRWGMVCRLSLAALLSVPFWHAPALVHWGGQGALQALFSSTLGVWRNRGAFLLNGLLWIALLMGLSLLLSLLMSLLGLVQLLPMLALPLGLLLSSVFYASLYFTFVDCFMFGAPKDVLGEPPRH